MSAIPPYIFVITLVNNFPLLLLFNTIRKYCSRTRLKVNYEREHLYYITFTDKELETQMLSCGEKVEIKMVSLSNMMVVQLLKLELVLLLFRSPVSLTLVPEAMPLYNPRPKRLE